MWCEDNGTYTALDNSTGDCLVREFTNKDDCLQWLFRKEIMPNRDKIRFLKRLDPEQWCELLKIILGSMEYDIKNVRVSEWETTTDFIVVRYQIKMEDLKWKNTRSRFDDDFYSPGYRQTQVPYVLWFYQQFGDEYKRAFLENYWERFKEGWIR